jgi:hypothetical protein
MNVILIGWRPPLRSQRRRTPERGVIQSCVFGQAVLFSKKKDAEKDGPAVADRGVA